MPKNDGKWNVGIEYQLKVIAYAAACLSENEDVEDFEIYTNQDDVPGFDDIIIKVKYKSEQKPFVYLGQIKHVKNKINFKGKKHSLNDYVRFIVQITNGKETNRFLKKLFQDVPDENVEYWYYSNSFFLDPLTQPIKLDDDIVCNIESATTNKSFFSVKNATDYFKLNTKDTDQFSHVFDRFRFLLNQPDYNKISYCIVNLNTDQFSIETANKIINYVHEYLKINTNTKLTKQVFETELLKLCLSTVIVSPTTAVKMNPQLADIWNKLIMENDVTVIDNTSLEMKPYIFGCLWQRMKHLYRCIFDWNKCITNFGKVEMAMGKNKFMELTKAKKFRYWLFMPDTIDALLIEMWKCDYLPLVLNSDTRTSTLNKYKHLNKTFIILDKNDKIYKEISCLKLKVFANAADIKKVELGNELLKNIFIALQGRDPVDIFSVLNDTTDLMKELRCDHLLHLIKERRIFLKEEALLETSSMFMILENSKIVDQTDIGQRKISDNDNVIKCMSGEVDLHIAEVKKNPKIKNYSIYVLEISDGKLEFIKGQRSNLKPYIIDEDGNDLYVDEDKVVPAIGKRFKKNEKYINRYLRKATIETTIFDSEKNIVYFLTDDVGSSNWIKRNKNKILHGTVDDYLVSQIELQIEEMGNAFVEIQGEDVEELWSKFSSKKYALLHLKVENDVMLLLKYHNCQNLSSYISYNGPKFSEKYFFQDTSVGIIVITGEPGVGKSTLLRSLFNACEKRNYVLFCDLNDYRQDLWERSPDLFKDPINFILRKGEQQCTLSSNRYVKCHSYLHFFQKILERTNELILFLDSFDEILPVCQEKVLDFIRILNRPNVRLIIASRLVKTHVLISSLFVNIVKVEILNTQDIKEYVNNEKLIFNQFNKYPLEFRENPMYLNFLITLQREKALPTSVTRSTLCNAIIQKHIERYYIKNDNFYAPMQYKNLRKDILDIHKLLALVEVFGNVIINKLGFAYNKLREECINTGRVKLGLIIQFDDNGPIFLHQTFAEFLAAEWLSENIDKNIVKYVHMVLLCEETVDIKRFLNDILCENLALHKAVLAEDLSLVETLCREDLKYLRQIDTLNRTALHLASVNCSNLRAGVQNYLILEGILRHMNMEGMDFSSRDSMGWMWTQYLESNNVFLTKAGVFKLTATIELYFACQNRVKEGITWSIGHGRWDIAIALLKKHICLLPMYLDFLAVEVIAKERLNVLCELIEVQSRNNMKLDKLCRACKNLHSVTEVSTCVNIETYGGFTALHIASLYGNINVVKELLSLGVHVNTVDNFKLKPLYYAVMLGSTDIVACIMMHNNTTQNKLRKSIYKLFKKNVSNRHYRQIIFQSYLHISVNKNYLEVTKTLLDNGIDIDRRNNYGETALHVAVNDNNIDKIKLLLNYNPNCNIQDNFGNVSLHIAVKNNRLDITSVLLQHGAKTDIRNNEYLFTSLHIASKNGNSKIVELLLESDADVNLPDKYGNTPLLIVASCKYSRDRTDDITKALLNAGANVNHRNKTGESALHMAALYNKENLLRMLLARGADVNIENEDGNTTLFTAIKRVNITIVTILLENGANVKHRNTIGTTALHIATDYKDADIVKMLLAYGADVDLDDMNGDTALFTAIKERSFEIITVLLQNAANVKHRNKLGNTVLHIAAEKSYVNLVEILLAYGADIDVENKDGDTALFVAIKAKSIEKVNVELKDITNDNCASKIQNSGTNYFNANFNPVLSKCIVNAVTNDTTSVSSVKENIHTSSVSLENRHDSNDLNKIGNAVLDIATNYYNANLKTVLSKYGEIAVIKNKNSDSNMFVATEKESVKLIRILLENGADINYQNRVGNTALHVAAKWGRIDAVKVLLDNKADGSVVNKKGKTALIVASKYGNLNIAELLLK